jgi:ABC-type multidrug transport system permease subunit
MSFRNSQLLNLILANAREILREPAVLFWGIGFPILMSLGLGFAFTSKKDVTVRIAVIGQNHLQQSPGDSASVIRNFLSANHAKLRSDKQGGLERELTVPDGKLGNTTYVFAASSWEKAMVQLKRGTLNLVIDERDGSVVYHFDPMNPDAQLTYLKFSKLMKETDLVVRPDDGGIESLTVKGTRYIDFLVPGLIAMGVMMACLWGVSYDIIEKRSKKLLRRMVATPMRKSSFLISLITVRTAMNFVEAGLLFLFSWLVFGITVQGSPAALLMIFIAGNIAFSGLSVFISSHTAKTEIGNGLINLVNMPMMLLSGIFFSYHNFPAWSIPVIQAFPLTMLADGVRSIFIEGAGFGEVLLPSAVLSLTGLIFFTAGLKIFKWH